MIDYATFQRLHYLQRQAGWTAPQIARELGLNIKTVKHWLTVETFPQRQHVARASKLTPFKDMIRRWVEQHPFSARQILQRLREQGYAGGYTILKEFLRRVRPVRSRTYLTLHYAPGECAQIDWGHAGAIPVGQALRRVSFLVVTLCYSRLMYLEFTLSQTLEHFLYVLQNALLYFGGVPAEILSDNLKTAVLRHAIGQAPVFHERYLDFAAHHGFTPKACAVRQPQAKGRVENNVGYVKKSLLNGLELTTLAAVNTAGRLWLDTVANVRIHGATRQIPRERFQNEKPALRPLNGRPYDLGLSTPVRVDSQFRVHFGGNRYSVPAAYASSRLTLKRTPDRLWFYHDDRLVAEHVRRYDSGQDYLQPDHEKPLLLERRSLREQRLLQLFLQLSPKAEDFYRQLEDRHLNARHHIRQIMALGELYPREQLVRALEDAAELQVYRAEYIANLLDQRRRQLPVSGALHLTRRQDLLELDLPAPNLETYEPRETHENNA
jgi:transposase